MAVDWRMPPTTQSWQAGVLCAQRAGLSCAVLKLWQSYLCGLCRTRMLWSSGCLCVARQHVARDMHDGGPICRIECSRKLRRGASALWARCHACALVSKSAGRECMPKGVFACMLSAWEKGCSPVAVSVQAAARMDVAAADCAHL